MKQNGSEGRDKNGENERQQVKRCNNELRKRGRYKVVKERQREKV